MTASRTRALPDRATTAACPRCHDHPLESEAYSFLLGIYLGDGHVVGHRRGRYVLSIACDSRYPMLADEVVAAVGTVRRGAVWRARKTGSIAVQSSWIHWPCLFPQHGPGPKHRRPIVLTEWQKAVVEEFPQPFLRGLLMSDGCRVMNRVRRPVAGALKEYAYPRYHFSNESEDILRLCEWALDLVGVEHRRNRPNSISVARSGSVDRLDSFVGAKR